jgi:hypothetical protein
MDVTGWLRMPGGPALTVALAIAPVLAVDLAQYFSRDELVLLRIPTPLRAAVYVAGAYVFILAGRFESNAFIYFQF